MNEIQDIVRTLMPVIQSRDLGDIWTAVIGDDKPLGIIPFGGRTNKSIEDFMPTFNPAEDIPLLCQHGYIIRKFDRNGNGYYKVLIKRFR